MSDSLTAIEEAIPHRAPMLLVDEICEQSEKEIHCRKSFGADEFFVQGHFPDQPLVPGVILCECALQAGAILLSKLGDNGSEKATVPVATRLDAVKFKRMVHPGDTVDLNVTLKYVVSNAYFLTGKVSVDGKLAARLDFACTLAESE